MIYMVNCSLTMSKSHSISLRLELIQSTNSLPNSELSSPLSAHSLQNSPHLLMQSPNSWQSKRANSLRTQSMEDCRKIVVPQTKLE